MPTKSKKHLPPDNLRTKSGRLTEEAKAWFYREVRRSGRNPYKIGEQIGISRATSRKLMRAISEQWADGYDLSPKQLAERLYAKTNEDGDLPDTPILAEIPDPITKFEDLRPVAQQAYSELGFWRTRYLGRRHILWQVEMCLLIMTWLEEARRRHERVRGVLNTPPGGGKTTTVTHDFPGWVISRDRNIRIGLGSRTTPQATAYSRRLRNTLERNILLNVDFGRFKPEETEIWRQDEFIVDGVTGTEASIEHRLALAGFDYSDPRIKRRLDVLDDPIHDTLKAIESTFVAGEKEATVKALSEQMGFLGGRFDLNLWDDLVDKKNSKNPEVRDSLAEWWEEYAVSRAEPGGVIVLTGTRFGRYDLFRYCRDMTYASDEDFDSMLLDRITPHMDDEAIETIKEDLMREVYDNRGEIVEAILTPKDSQDSPINDPRQPEYDPDNPEYEVSAGRTQHKVYRYVKYPAHNEEPYNDDSKSPDYNPHGCKNPTSLKSVDHVDCLLDPIRFKWHDLLRAKAANLRKFALTYQQEDQVDEENLIQEVWLTGGADEDNVMHAGCYNYGRRLLEVPSALDETDRHGYVPRQDCYSIATVDPSAVNYWSVQWWIWHSTTDHDYLIDILRARLSSDSFLSYSVEKQEYHGIMEQWQQRSKQMNWPIGLWIIEENAAQRYLFQHTWVMEWMQKNGVQIKGHETDPRKADPEYGVQTLRPRYRQGRVDLPYTQDDLRTRAAINEFKQELTEWPDSPTDDMVNGHWFLEANRWHLSDGLKVINPLGGPIRHPYQDSVTDRMQNDSIHERTSTDTSTERSTGRGHRHARRNNSRD